MPEEEKATANDVSPDDYNKVVAAKNSAQAELEEARNKIKELEEKKEEEKKVEETDKWKKEAEEQKKQNEELRKKMDETVKAKGIVQDTKEKEQKANYTVEQTKSMLDEAVPTDGFIDPENFGSNIERWAHFKNPRTKISNSAKLGKILSLAANVPNNPKAMGKREDMILHQGYRDLANG